MAEQLPRDRYTATVYCERSGDDAQVLYPLGADSGERLAGGSEPQRQVLSVFHGFQRYGSGAADGRKSNPEFSESESGSGQSESEQMGQPVGLWHVRTRHL